MDSQIVQDWALSRRLEAEQPDRAKGKGSQFNQTDPQDKSNIPSINSQDMSKDGDLVYVYRGSEKDR